MAKRKTSRIELAHARRKHVFSYPQADASTRAYHAHDANGIHRVSKMNDSASPYGADDAASSGSADGAGGSADGAGGAGSAGEPPASASRASKADAASARIGHSAHDERYRSAPSRPHFTSRKPRKQGIVRRTINGWWDRLLGAASERSFSDQAAEYAAHRTNLDFAWNTVGLVSWGIVFPFLTVIITQLLDANEAGIFSLAFVTASLLMIIGNYGVRIYQVSDLDENISFSDYQANRWITCLAMLAIAFLICQIRGYDTQIFTVTISVCIYKMVDALADVYEGRLQQQDKLYLAGVSQMVRSLSVLALFTVALVLTHSLAAASVAMAVGAVVTFLILTLPLAFLETPRSARMRLSGVVELFKQCFPLFIALFLYSFIDNMPKFVMDGVLTADNQLYFNALYFPAQAILISAGFVYKPLIVRMANAWADRSQRKQFDRFVLAMLGIIAVITVIGILLMAWVGIPIMGFLYGVDFEQFRALSYIMLVTGGITACIDFFYQVITVMRRQQVVTRLYLVTFGCALVIPFVLIHLAGLTGAVLSYLAIMAILFTLLVIDYIGARVRFQHHPENDPTSEFDVVKIG